MRFRQLKSYLQSSTSLYYQKIRSRTPISSKGRGCDRGCGLGCSHGVRDGPGCCGGHIGHGGFVVRNATLMLSPFKGILNQPQLTSFCRKGLACFSILHWDDSRNVLSSGLCPRHLRCRTARIHFTGSTSLPRNRMEPRCCGVVMAYLSTVITYCFCFGRPCVANCIHQHPSASVFDRPRTDTLARFTATSNPRLGCRQITKRL